MDGASDSVHRQNVGFQLLHRDRAHSANCSVDLSFHGAVLGRCRHARCCTMTGAWVTTVQKPVEVPQLQFSDNVVDILVVAQTQIPMF